MKAQKRSSGITLIEMLIVMAVIAILAAVALPSYERYILRGYRTEARNALLEIAARQERFRYNSPVYAASLGALGYTTDPYILPKDRYSVSMTAVVDPADPQNTSYTIRATPINAQQKDNTICGWLELNHQNLQTSQVVNDECWRR
jgi:type IV pilus assembly protein PilE